MGVIKNHASGLTPKHLGSPFWMADLRACCLSTSLVTFTSSDMCTFRSLETVTAISCRWQPQTLFLTPRNFRNASSCCSSGSKHGPSPCDCSNPPSHPPTHTHTPWDIEVEPYLLALVPALETASVKSLTSPRRPGTDLNAPPVTDFALLRQTCPSDTKCHTSARVPSELLLFPSFFNSPQNSAFFSSCFFFPGLFSAVAGSCEGQRLFCRRHSETSNLVEKSPGLNHLTKGSYHAPWRVNCLSVFGSMAFLMG